MGHKGSRLLIQKSRRRTQSKPTTPFLSANTSSLTVTRGGLSKRLKSRGQTGGSWISETSKMEFKFYKQKSLLPIFSACPSYLSLRKGHRRNVGIFHLVQGANNLL